MLRACQLPVCLPPCLEPERRPVGRQKKWTPQRQACMRQALLAVAAGRENPVHAKVFHAGAGPGALAGEIGGGEGNLKEREKGLLGEEPQGEVVRGKMHAAAEGVHSPPLRIASETSTCDGADEYCAPVDVPRCNAVVENEGACSSSTQE